MVRAVVYLFILLQVHLFSDGYLLLVEASEVPSGDSENSSTCSSTDPSDCTADNKNEEQEQIEDHDVSSPWAFMQAFSKLGASWNHVIGEYISVVKGADGVDIKGDVHAKDMEEGLHLLQSMVHEAASVSKEEELAWSFHTTPLDGKNIDDVLIAFLRWSIVDNSKSSQDDKSCKLIGGINAYPSSIDGVVNISNVNVSKAFRRLKSYVQWMQSVSSDLIDTPLTFQSITDSLSTFSIHITHDSCGRLIWWVNLGKTDLSAFKSHTPRETTRLFVWVAHLLFLDEGAQTKGLVVVDDLSEISFWEYMTMLPIQVGISVDRFLISVTPLKAKNVVLMHLPRWAEIGYGLLSWFLNAKMKSRVTIVSKGDEMETLNNVAGGAEFIPAGFGPVGGELEEDIMAKQHELHG